MTGHNDNSLKKNRLFNPLYRRRYLACALSAVVLGLSSPAVTAQQQTADISIEAQTLENALIVFSTQTGLGIFARGDQVRHVRIKPVSGSMSPENALRRMLEGTGLAYEHNEDGTYVVIPAPEVDPKEAGRRNIRVEEVYVTARKREESVQDIPISITAFSAEDLRAAGIRSLSDMEGIVPGVNMGGGGNGVKKDSNPFIRGVGQRETKVTLDPAVGTYIDGIYLSRTAGAMLDTVGVERIEVLRGPQGTLFGRNTTGGAISVTTKKPHNEFGGNVSVNVGNYNRSDASFMLNVPIVDDQLMSRLTVSSKNSEGQFENIIDNTKWNDDNRISGIGQLRWIPTDGLMFDLFVERTRIREKPRAQRCVYIRDFENVGQPYHVYTDGTINPNYNPNYFFNPAMDQVDKTRESHGLPSFKDLCQQSEALPSDKFASDMAEGDELLEEGRYWVDTHTIGLTGEWEIGELGPLSDVQFKSISSWRKVEQIADEDLDGVGGPYLLRIQPQFNETTQFSQEFQFTGSALNDRLLFSTGFYYFQEETPQDVLIRAAGVGQMAEPDTFGRISTFAYEPTKELLETENESFAWYGQLDFSITSNLQLTAGLRYTKEDRWSRYSKAYALKDSIILGENYQNQAGEACTLTCRVEALQPGLAKMKDWQFGPMVGEELSTTDEAWTPMITLKYQLEGALMDRFRINDAMTYITYSEGFHAGGVTSGAIEYDEGARLAHPDGTPMPPPFTPEWTQWLSERVNFPADPGYGVEDPIIFKPEKVKNYEIGLKMQAFDRRIQANFAAYYMDYTDMQITSVAEISGLAIPYVDNIGKSVIKGAEAEFVFLPTPNWRVIANTSYTDAQMKEWDSDKSYRSLFAPGAIGTTSFDRSDEPMPRVPRWQAFLLTDYSFNLPNGAVLTPSITARYTSEIYHGFDRGSFLYAKDAVTADAVTFFDARINYLSANGNVDISLWVKNLTDKDDYVVGGIPLVDVTGATGQIYGNPRTFGLEMTYHFGGG